MSITFSSDTAKVTVSQLNTVAQGIATASDGRFAKSADLGTLASKSSVTKTELGTTLKEEIEGKANASTTLNGYGITDAYTKTEIDGKLTSAYKAAGSKTASQLTSDLLVKANEGKVYNVSDTLTLSNTNKGLFVENANGTYPAGTNVVVIESSAASYVATEDNEAQDGKTYYADANGTALDTQPTTGSDISESGYYELVPAGYKFDIQAGFVDLSNYATNSDVATATADDITAIVNGLYASE